CRRFRWTFNVFLFGSDLCCRSAKCRSKTKHRANLRRRSGDQRPSLLRPERTSHAELGSAGVARHAIYMRLYGAADLLSIAGCHDDGQMSGAIEPDELLAWSRRRSFATTSATKDRRTIALGRSNDCRTVEAGRLCHWFIR